jgi:hypothetical protein
MTTNTKHSLKRSLTGIRAASGLSIFVLVIGLVLSLKSDVVNSRFAHKWNSSPLGMEFYPRGLPDTLEPRNAGASRRVQSKQPASGIHNQAVEVVVLSPPFNPTFKTTGAAVELVARTTGPNQIVNVSWHTDGGTKGSAVGRDIWRSGRIPLVLGMNHVTVTAEDVYSSIGSTTVTVERVENPAEESFSQDVRSSYYRGQQITYSVVDDVGIFEGDIVLGSVDQLEFTSEDKRRMSKAGGTTQKSYLWPNGTVPYTIGSNPTSDVQAAIDHWNAFSSHTGVTLVPRSNQSNYVNFNRASNLCNSSVGMVGAGRQDINYGDCGSGGVVHEIGHAVGLWHEQSRWDRNDKVRIISENIIPDSRFNFDQYALSGIDIGAYDYGSIMHYPTHAFSANGQPTIETIPPNISIGQRSGLSSKDRDGVKFLYQCGSNAYLPGENTDSGPDQRHFVAGYERNGGKSQVGCSLNAVHNWSSGRVQDFNGGAGGKGALMKPDGSAFVAWIHGAIWDYYEQHGGPNNTFWDGSKLGYPTDDEKRGQNSSISGAQTSYSVCQNGSINFYGTGPRAGQTYIVRGAILTQWSRACSPGCYEAGPLGMPIGEESAAASSPYGTTGRYQDFESGQIYWHASGARQNQTFYVQHGIAEKYKSMGSGSALGFPISNEYVSGGVPRNDFEGGYIYWNGSQAIVVLNGQNYSISVSASPSNGGTVTGGGSFSSGSSRTVTATTNSGYSFINWTENGSVVSSSASYTFTLNSNRNLVANFTTTSSLLPPPALGSPGTTSAPGSSISTLTPTFSWQPVTGADGYALYVSRFNGSTYDLIFDTQIDVGQPLISTSYTLPSGRLQDGNQYRWNMSSHNSAGYGSPNVTRNYFYVSLSAQNYTINVSASPAAGGSVTGSGTFASGSSRTVTAAANSGYSFVNWTENGSVVSTSGSYTFTLNTNRTLVANFAQQSGCQSTPIGIGQTLNGSLSTSDCIYPGTSKYYDLYSFSGTAGQQISASMNSSAFDTYLYLTNSAGQVLAEDNNSGPGTNSRIVGLSSFFTLPGTGTYYLWPTSAVNNLTGAYSVSLSQCTFAISSSENTVGPGYGGGSFSMDTPSGCNWSAVSDSTSWLTTSSSGSGDGRVSYDFTANPNASPRTGRITVGGRVSTITQIGIGGAGTVQFSAATYSVNETAGNVTITVTRSGSGDGTVQYSTSNGSATTGTDYTSVSGTLFFNGNETSESFNVPILDDGGLEGNETINLSLSNKSSSLNFGNPTSATITILDNDTLSAPTANAATNISSNGVTANWATASGATGYLLDVSTNNSFSSFVSGYQNLDVGNSLSRPVTGLIASTLYYYRVRAYNGGGTSANSNTITVSTLGPMILIEQGTTNRAAALDSILWLRGPFKVLNFFNFTPDNHTRVMLFTSDLGMTQPDSSQLNVRAAGVTLTIESVGPFMPLSGMNTSFIVVRLPDGLPPGDLPLIVTLRGVASSNSPTLAISQ